ncbi:MAG: hypothetical protein HOK72_02040 [Flavobacteriales bacterium]|jgi:hypothetical protein|nr:hypothetical protein [Flavobacteriales bacterium]
MKKFILSIMVIGGSFSFANAQETNNSSNEIKNQEQKEKQKKELIQNNPEAYQAKGGVVSEPEFNTRAEKDTYDQQMRTNNDPVRERVIMPNDPTFPKYVNTGNKSVDAANYSTAKDEWINNNQSKYDQMGTPEGAPRSKEARLKSDENLNK